MHRHLGRVMREFERGVNDAPSGNREETGGASRKRSARTLARA
jgi:hypothetical protein